MRGLLVSVLCGVMVGCGCPPSPCRDWVYVSLSRPEPWQEGVWQVSLSADRLALDCTVTVPEDGWSPTLLDLACNDRVDRSAFVVDTGLWDGAETLRLRVPLTEDTSSEPPSARVVVGFTPPGGERVEVAAADMVLPWRASRPQAGACAADCQAADLTVRVPTWTPDAVP